MKYKNTQTEEFLKREVCREWFNKFETNVLPEKGNRIDCCISIKDSVNSIFGLQSLLWAEAKASSEQDIFASFVQLVLTVGRDGAFRFNIPPKYFGAFDNEKIAFVPCGDVMRIFYENDINWRTTPSNHQSEEFQKLYNLLKNEWQVTLQVFNFTEDAKQLKEYIAKNFNTLGDTNKMQVDDTNFVHIYARWRSNVKPYITVDWEEMSSKTIHDAAFFIADLISKDNFTIYKDLSVELHDDEYELMKKQIGKGLFSSAKIHLSGEAKKRHAQFWSIFERPPKEIYQKIILERYDLLVPQDFRQRKGAFFTPKKWVELSQKYIADTLGQNWQEEYYIWDCAAGTGNLLNGLNNKYRIFASTLDEADVSAMHVQIERDGDKARLLKEHVFQFDFLNDELPSVITDGQDRKTIKGSKTLKDYNGKLPKDLVEILTDNNKRKKLIIYINPPYAEATTATTVTGTGSNKAKVATDNATYEKYRKEMGKASNELFCQFLIKIYREIPGATLANFSTLKNLQASNFVDFRRIFQPKLEKLFIVPAKSFDNVAGSFPIGFFIWNAQIKEPFTSINADVYDIDGYFMETKTINNLDFKDIKNINKWIKKLDTENENIIGYMENPTPDFQNNKYLCILNNKGTRHNNYSAINKETLIPNSVYFSVRLCIEPDWINDRQQFYTPNNDWEEDTEFLNDCLTFTLFNSQNRITCNNDGGKVNHWIPFTEEEVGAKGLFSSNFMIEYIQGKRKPDKSAKEGDLFSQSVNEMKENNNPNGVTEPQPLVFSPEAQEVFNAGRELWRYYHLTAGSKENKDRYNVNASYYDIREFFQGRDAKSGRMNNKSQDEHYTELVGWLRLKEKELGNKIAQKVYQYGFLR